MGRVCGYGLCGSGLNRETEIRKRMQGIFGIVCHRKQKEDGSESPETRRKEFLEIFGVLTMKKLFFFFFKREGVFTKQDVPTSTSGVLL